MNTRDVIKRSSGYKRKKKKNPREKIACEEVGPRESRSGLLLERRHEDLWSRDECGTRRDAKASRIRAQDNGEEEEETSVSDRAVFFLANQVFFLYIFAIF